MNLFIYDNCYGVDLAPVPDEVFELMEKDWSEAKLI